MVKNADKKFGKFIRDRRKKVEQTIENFAKFLNKSEKMIKDYESGKKPFPERRLYELSIFLKMPLHKLMEKYLLIKYNVKYAFSDKELSKIKNREFHRIKKKVLSFIPEDKKDKKKSSDRKQNTKKRQNKINELINDFCKIEEIANKIKNEALLLKATISELFKKKGE